VTLNYGAFVTNIVSFLIIAFAVFVLVRLANRLYAKPVVTTDTTACPYCIAAIPLAATRCPQCTSQLAGP
jgi:large conductance mechanosensitive channel